MCIIGLPSFEFGTIHSKVKGFQIIQNSAAISIELGQTGLICRLA
jgi:hypothetical protein